MASTWSELGIRLMATGENSNAWGGQTNDNWNRIEDAADGFATVAVSGATTLTFTTEPTSYADENGRNKVLQFTGTAGSTQAITFPNIEKTYHVLNDSNSILTLTTGTGAATVSLAAGKDMIIYNDGSDEIHNALANLSTTTLSTGAFTATDGSTITTADNTDTLTLTSTDADANSGPNLRFYRNSGSPADGDDLAYIEFEGRNDNSQDVVYGRIRTQIKDASDSSEDGKMDLGSILAGTEIDWLTFNPADPASVIFNEGSADIDFRVESNGNANMLFVDGGNDKIGVGTSSGNAILSVSSGFAKTDTTSRSVLSIQSNDASAQAQLKVMNIGGASAADRKWQFQTSENGVANAGQLEFQVDGGSVQMGTTGGGHFFLNSAATVFNEGSTDTDFRIESNGNANMIFVDGGNNHVNIGTATDLGGTLNVNGVMTMAESDTVLLRITSSGSDVKFQNRVSNKDISFEGIDGSSAITALHLDMATAGTATFNDNIVMGTAGKGIHLGVNSATASNLLDDYEEGTYTPAMTVASGSLTVHNSHNTLAYTKIGRVVHVQGEVRFSAISSPSGNFSLNLPFAVADLGEGAARFTSAPIGQSGFSGTPNQTYYGRVTSEGSTTMSIATHNSGSDTGVNANQVTTSTEMIFSFTFIAA